MGGSSLLEVVGEDLRAEVSLVGGSSLSIVVDDTDSRVEDSFSSGVVMLVVEVGAINYAIISMMHYATATCLSCI